MQSLQETCPPHLLEPVTQLTCKIKEAWPFAIEHLQKEDLRKKAFGVAVALKVSSELFRESGNTASIRLILPTLDNSKRIFEILSLDVEQSGPELIIEKIQAHFNYYDEGCMLVNSYQRFYQEEREFIDRVETLVKPEDKPELQRFCSRFYTFTEQANIIVWLLSFLQRTLRTLQRRLDADVSSQLAALAYLISL